MVDFRFFGPFFEFWPIFATLLLSELPEAESHPPGVDFRPPGAYGHNLWKSFFSDKFNTNKLFNDVLNELKLL
jgi:hypothetical protein